MLCEASGLLAVCILLIWNPLFNAVFCCNIQAVSERPCRWSLSLSVPPVHPPHSARLTPRAVQRTTWNGMSCKIRSRGRVQRHAKYLCSLHFHLPFPQLPFCSKWSIRCCVRPRALMNLSGVSCQSDVWHSDTPALQLSVNVLNACSTAWHPPSHTPSIQETRDWLTAVTAAQLTPAVRVGYFSTAISQWAVTFCCL